MVFNPASSALVLGQRLLDCYQLVKSPVWRSWTACWVKTNRRFAKCVKLVYMARGWESKAVESQIEAAATRSEQSRVNQLQAAEISLQRERESLELSRTRVLQDLAKAENPRYKEQLERSLMFLDEKLAALNGAGTKSIKHHA